MQKDPLAPRYLLPIFIFMMAVCPGFSDLDTLVLIYLHKKKGKPTVLE